MERSKWSSSSALWWGAVLTSEDSRIATSYENTPGSGPWETISEVANLRLCQAGCRGPAGGAGGAGWWWGGMVQARLLSW